ncbi:ATP-binding protein involved in chromosome partitioning [Ferrithrix thermotolerans DSM 19514]|uniref:Iron-sulfur cluster carrier protein n=1 Tax=Ferrithrix thermotolerans DSM 19514 TaxID=1121881 RepID=A0A1M4TF74_9ACTN|nr:P-loop NTPase [Ferrithrix thermotolerans]SHE43142.1 ATP-binding protein involved in chromosome partitioning [Ferrithrix thermotolerans DSM 19514]
MSIVSFDPESMRERLRDVIDPELGTDIVTLGMVQGIEQASADSILVNLALTTIRCPLRAKIQHDIETVARGFGITSVVFRVVEMNKAEKAAAMKQARANAAKAMRSSSLKRKVKVVALASGKGGVGKSTLSVQVAMRFARAGYRVGLLDADIWGYSTVRMLLGDKKKRLDAKGDSTNFKIQPLKASIEGTEISLVSMGLLADSEDEAIMWRGPMLSRALQHFVDDVEWGDIDYLFIDMPPGTGDIQLGLSRLLPQSKVIVVTTPSIEVATVATRVADMCKKTGLEIAGVVENMSYFICEHGSPYSLFGEGGGAFLAERADAHLVAKVPLLASSAEASVTSVGTSDNQSFRKALDDIFEYLLDWFARKELETASCTSKMLRLFEDLEDSL